VRLAALVSLFTLAACGSGGDDAPAPAPAPAATTTVTGVAASGAAFTGATVTVTDSRGTVVGSTAAPVGTNGTYSVTLAAGAVPPFVLTATRTMANGATDSLVSVLPSAGSATVNLTPLTTLVASRLSPSGNPLTLAAEVQAKTATVDPASVAAKTAEVKQIVAPAMAATNTTNVDLLNGTFAVDGTGHDRLLDTLTVNIIPASGTSANIEVGLKVQGAAGAQPPVIRFTNADNLAAITAANAAVLGTQIDPATVVASGTNVRIQEFLARLTACHALPLAERVNANALVAADVTAPACRSLFLGDNPAGYLSDGNPVGKFYALPSLFLPTGNGLVFGQGSYEYTQANGDIAIGYTTRRPDGAETIDTLVVRLVGSAFKLVGNGHVYPGHVYPFMQHRRFDAAGTPAYNYRSTGYVTQVVNRVNPQTGVPIFDRVEVVTPGGATLVMRPAAATQTLVLMRGDQRTNTSYVRLRSAFDDTATAGTPAAVESPNIFFLSQDLADADVAAIPAQSVWTYRYYLAANPTVLAATQYYRTRARALTIPEFRTRPLAAFGPQTLAAFQAATAKGPVELAGLGGLSLGWTVPDGALPPVQAILFGTVPSAGGTAPFTDYIDVPSTARQTTIPCATATVADTHCTSDTPRKFAAGTVATGAYLLARERSGREVATYYATYKVPVN
jgi:hypothetical protein